MVGVIGVVGFGVGHLLYYENARITLNPLGTFGVFVDERGGISGNSGHHITGVMWGGNQRIDQWIKWWVCFADAVGSNLEWAGNLLRKCALYMPYDVEEG